jgi:hypothetical protein
MFSGLQGRIRPLFPFSMLRITKGWDEKETLKREKSPWAFTSPAILWIGTRLNKALHHMPHPGRGQYQGQDRTVKVAGVIETSRSKGPNGERRWRS